MSVNGKILKLAVPSILANITVPIVGMADIAVAGHLDSAGSDTASSAAMADPVSTATMIGGIAIGTMLFDLLYWNFGFLRVGTGGLTAQACGRGDMREGASILSRALGIALACSAVLIAIQWLFVKGAFLFVDATPQVKELASQYFFIRIWAAPATLSLMAFKGWFIGMQDGVSPMITDLTVNVMNVLMSIVLALGLHLGAFSFDGVGFKGIAAGTVAAQYTGLTVAVSILLLKYWKKVFEGFSAASLAGVFKGGETRRFFSMNADLFIRSLCFIGIYIGFTTLAAHYGDLVLAAGSILMKLMMIFSYFTDGFAYAGGAMAGRYIGSKNRAGLVSTVKYVFIWSMGIAALFMVLYGVAGMPMLRIMTSDAEVVEMCRPYLPWLLLMPVIGCAAFTWDGIYIGATSARTMRNAMIWATAGFFLTYLAGIALAGIGVKNAAGVSGPTALHILLAAYFVHLLARTVHLSLRYRKVVLSQI